MGKKKKRFADTTVGKILTGAASIISPPLGQLIAGSTSVNQALEAISGSDLAPGQKVELQKAIFAAQAEEERQLSERVKSDNQHEITRKVRPYLALWYTLLFAVTLVMDAVPTIPFQLSTTSINALAAINATIIGFWFGGRTLEKVRGV